jgi:ribonuclease G
MQKELIISTTPQETKLAILEDDELVEFYIERHRSLSIVGNIYKGKVTKVLPGMQSAFVDIGLERDAFLYVSDFFEDTEEYEKIVSTVEDEVAELQETARGKPHVSAPAATAMLSVAETETEQTVPAAIQSGEILAETERLEPAPAGPAGAGGLTTEDYDRRGGRGRRDRDRRGKKPKIPSFESKAYESRSEERPYTSLEVLPGESLAKLTRRPEPEHQPEKPSAEAVHEPAPSASGEERNASPGDVAEAPTAPSDSRPEPQPQAQPHAESPLPPEIREEGVVSPRAEPASSATLAESPAPAEPSAESPVSAKAPMTASEPPRSPASSETPANEEQTENRSPSSVRITDRSDQHQFAHRSASRRARRARGGPPPAKPEELRTNGHSPKTGPMISELLREGQEILVQVSKEPLGKKGARITSHIALPGRYLVYMPTVDHVGVSRKIASDEERSRLKRIIHEHRNGLPGGFIVRTAAEGRGEDEFIQDIRFLGNLWADIRAKSEKKSAPALIHREMNLVQRLLRDQLSQDYRAIRLDNEAEFATVLDFVSKFQPALVNRVKLHLKDTPIFEEYGLNTELEKALRPKVWLKSGGYIVINQTEALVAIDVNTGKYVGKSNRLEDTIVRTNVDAVHEIVRQIRLRNLGGIIVVDFIDMEEKKNRQRVMAALEEAVRADRVPSKILQFNDFGLVAITRKRTQPSLERTLCRPCPHCNGSGWSKSPETICYEIQQEIKKMAHLFDGKEITVRVNPEIAKALKSGEFVSLNEIEDWTKKDILVKSDPLLHEEHFDIF